MQGRNCETDWFLLKLVFDQFDGAPVHRKFKVQFSSFVDPLISEVGKKMKNVLYKDIAG